MPKNKSSSKSAVPRLRGQGGYYSDKIVPNMRKIVPDGTFARLGSNLGTSGGTLAGSRFGIGSAGGAVGGKLGGFLGKGISRLLGFGDYTVVNNSLFKEGMAIAPGESVPSFGVMGAETRVKHREYIRDVLVPVSPLLFTNTSYTINPGDSVTFPWLSDLAANYQQYKINGMVFEFKTLSSDITAGGALGSVVLSTNYNVLDAQFVDKVHMENSQFAVSAKPSCSQIHTVECDPAQTANPLRYVRDASSSTTTSQDARFYDLGKFQIATVGLPGSAGAVLGELWVSYDVSLYKPILADRIAISGKVIQNGATKANLFSTTATVTGPAATAAVNTLTFPRSGVYFISLLQVGTVLVNPTVLASTATTILIDNSTMPAAGQSLSNFRAHVTSGGQTVVFDATGSTTVTAAVAYISSYSLTV